MFSSTVIKPYEPGYFIKKRGLFTSRFGKFKDMCRLLIGPGEDLTADGNIMVGVLIRGRGHKVRQETRNRERLGYHKNNANAI